MSEARVRVVLWHGDNHNDAVVRFQSLVSMRHVVFAREVRLEGVAGDWWITASMRLADPVPDVQARGQDTGTGS